MALGDPYATLAELKLRLSISDTVDDSKLTDALAAASRGVEKYCGRQFNKQTGATARLFYPCNSLVSDVDDLWTSASLVVATDPADTGTWATTWTTTEYQLYPFDGVVDGETGWPFYRVNAVSGKLFPVWTMRPSVQVTAQWGWAAVPALVKEATLVAAEETFKLKDAPFAASVRVSGNKHLTDMLDPYRRHPILVG